MCKKYNVRLCICYKSKYNISYSQYYWVYEYARNLKSIKNFNKIASIQYTVYDSNIFDNQNDHYECYEINQSVAIMENYI